MKILVVDHTVPQPHHTAGDRAISDLVSGLVDLGHEVAFYPDAFAQGHSAANLPPGADPQIARRMVGEPGTGPEGLAPWFGSETPDVAIVSRPGTGAYYLELLDTRPQVARILFGHDLHAARMERGAQFGSYAGRPQILAMTAVERISWRGYDVPVYPSTNETDHIDRVLGVKGHAVAMPIYRLGPLPPPEPAGRSGCAFVGGVAHEPNDDAVAWFGASILPLVRRALPDTTLTVIGEWPEHLRHHDEGVTYTGQLDADPLDDVMAVTRVVVAPLRWGAGVKRKVVAAMHRGIPLVSTSVGLEGVGAATDDGRARAVQADNAGDFAAAVTRLITDDDEWRSLSEAAHSSITHVYGDDAYLRALEGVLALASERGRSRR